MFWNQIPILPILVIYISLSFGVFGVLIVLLERSLGALDK